jgi:histidinol phosphatase-like enzyme (inositol monophosphatase family)
MHANQTEISSRRDLALQLAREAGEITLKYFLRNDLRVELKDDQSPVTVADREAEAHMRRRIERAFPTDGIVGEEQGEQSGTSGYSWVLDPIDGTKSFVAGVPLYATLIAVLEGEESRVGVVNAAAAGEMVYATSGAGAWFVRHDASPRPAQVSQVGSLANALLVTTEVNSFAKFRKPDATDVFVALQQQARLTRTWGDGYGYLLVVTGRAEVMIDPAMHLWDAAPLLPLLEEAGGRFVDWNGNRTYRAGEGVGTNAKILDKVLEYTRGH